MAFLYCVSKTKKSLVKEMSYLNVKIESNNQAFCPFTLRCGSRLLSYSHPAVVGILNVTPDSFYDGGRHLAQSDYVKHAGEMIEQGADMIDLGVVSTRPGSVLPTPDEEARSFEKVLANLRREFPEVVISVDTCRSLPAKAAIEAGADIVNDVGSGVIDERMFETVAALQVPYILTHNPRGSESDPPGRNHTEEDGDLFDNFVAFMSERVDMLRRLGVADIILDPGFGFSKTLQQSYSILARLGDVKSLFPETPIMAALSRKSMIFKLLETTPQDSLVGTVALHATALMAGAQLLRVHDVRAAIQTIKVVEQVMKSRPNE